MWRTHNVLVSPAVCTNNSAHFHLEIPNERGNVPTRMSLVAPASVIGTQNEDTERHACGRTVAGFICTLCSYVQMVKICWGGVLLESTA